MRIELNGNKHKVRRYKGEHVDAYMYRGVLYDDKPKHRDISGIFKSDNSIIGVVDTLPSCINRFFVYLMLSLLALVLSVTLCIAIDNTCLYKFIRDYTKYDANIIYEYENNTDACIYSDYVYFNRNISVHITAKHTCIVQVVGPGIDCEPVLLREGDIVHKLTATIDWDNYEYAYLIIITGDKSTLYPVRSNLD